MEDGQTYLCRSCRAPLVETFVDLGLSPLCESYVSVEELRAPETLYPLHSFVCEKCFLVQLPEHVSPQAIFEEYAYFSSYSILGWLTPAITSSKLQDDFNSTRNSLVMEIASNDGYLLQYFCGAQIPVSRESSPPQCRPGQPSPKASTSKEFFGTDRRAEIASEGRPGRSFARQQRSRARARHQ